MLSAYAILAAPTAPVLSFEVTLPTSFSVRPSTFAKDFSASWTVAERAEAKVLTVSFSDTDGDAYVELFDARRSRSDGTHPSCTLDLGNNYETFKPLVSTLFQAGLVCTPSSPKGSGKAVVVEESVAAYSGTLHDCNWDGAECVKLDEAALATVQISNANNTFCCTSCAAGGCSAFYSPKDVGRPYACSKGEHIVDIPNHGKTCAPSSTPSAMSLSAATVYSASFGDGPQPAVYTSCVAYQVKPDRSYLNLHSGFSASAGGELWAHDTLIFTLSGSLASGQTAALRFTNATAARAPFMLRISAPAIAPAVSLTFKASDDTACPSEHCLLPDVSKSLPGTVHTPKCGFGAVGASVEQPISPDLPAGTPLLIDVTSLVSKGTRYLKVAVVPEQSTQDGFWDSKLQLSGAQLVVH